MSTGSAGPALRAQAPEDLRAFLHVVGEWLGRHVGTACLSALVGAVLACGLNAFLLFVVHSSHQVAPGVLAFGQGNALWGSLGFGLGGLVFGALFGYWRAVGSQRFFGDLGGLPAALGLIFKRDGAAARVHLLWGAAVSLAAANLISPWVGILLAASLMSSLPSLLGRLISGLLLRLWSDLARHAAPSANRRPLGLSGMTVGLLGSALALGIGFVLPGVSTKLAFAGACAITALILSRRIPPGAAAILAFVEFAWLALGDAGSSLVVHAFACVPGECVPGEMKPWGGTGMQGMPLDVPAALLRSAGAGLLAGAGAWAGSGVGGVLGEAVAAGGGGDGLAAADLASPAQREAPPESDSAAAAKPGFRADPAKPVAVPERFPPGSIVPDSSDDLPQPDSPRLVPDKEDDLPALDAGPTAKEPPPADVADDFPETSGEATPGDGAMATPPATVSDATAYLPKAPSPTAEKTEAGRQAKLDRLHDIIKTLAAMKDVDKRNQLIGIVKNAAQVDAQGLPRGDLERIAAMVRQQSQPDESPGLVAEAIEQTKDFVKGVGEDIHDLGAAGADMAKGAARDLKDLATDAEFGKDFWDGTHDTITKGADLIDKGINAAAQSGRDFARDVEDLATDAQFSSDFWDSANANLDKAAHTVKQAADEATQIGKDVLSDPSILGDTLSGTLDDLQDPGKVAEAIRKGVPGGERLLNAMDKSRPVTERLTDALLGAAEWAGAADSVADAGELFKGGARLIGDLGSDLGGKLAGLSDDLGVKLASKADDLGKTLADDVAQAMPTAGKALAEDAGTLGAAAGKLEKEAVDGADDLLKAGERGLRQPGVPESQAPLPLGANERGTEVRNMLREKGYRQNLVERVDYEPVHASGSKDVLGSTRDTGRDAEAVIHSSAFDEGRTSLRSTAEHEVDHVLQHGQLETQAAPHGPKADWIDEDGKWTAKGREMAEMEVRMQELDRNLLTRESAIRRSGANPADRSTWPREALDADKEVAGARGWLEKRQVGEKTMPDLPTNLEPPGEDLYKVSGPTAPAVRSMQTIPGFRSEAKAQQWVSEFKKVWADNPNLNKSAAQFADTLSDLSDKPGIGKLAKDLVQGDSTTAGASGALNWAKANKDAIKSIEATAEQGRRGADFVLERRDALGNVVREVAEVKTYNWSNPVYHIPRHQERTAERIVQQLAERASNPEYANHGLRLAMNDMDHMPPKLKDLVANKLSQRGLSERVTIESFNHFHNFSASP